MKYRLFEESNEEIIVIMEDGGIACISKVEECEPGDGRIAITEYYKERINNDTDPDDVFGELGEGASFYNEWTKAQCNDHCDPRLIQNALEWLAAGETFERDDSIWTNIF